MRCESCPVRIGPTCLGEWHKPVCLDVANGLPGRAEQLVGQAERPPAPQPSLVEMAGSFAKAAVAHFAEGGRKASDEVQADRKAICLACPHHDPDKDGCRACGCGTIEVLSIVGLDLDLKRSWASSICADDPPRWV